MIHASDRFYRHFGRDHTSSKDLDWSGTLIFNSSETSLCDQVTERLTTVPADERGGPLFFQLMMGIVTSTLSEAIETLVDNFAQAHTEGRHVSGQRHQRTQQDDPR
jgi:hypothetical protein